MEIWDFIRSFNIVLNAGLLYVVCMRTARDWPAFGRRARVNRLHFIGYLLVLAYGSVETLAMQVPPGARIVALSVVHVSFALGLYRTRKDPPEAVPLSAR